MVQVPLLQSSFHVRMSDYPFLVKLFKFTCHVTFSYVH